MKGIIFREFLNMVENKFGYEMVDQIIEDSNLPNNGAYTAVGTYPHTEIVRLVSNLSKRSNIDVSELLETFGQHAFGVFTVSYKNLLVGYYNAFSFLTSVENTIHVEVLKLYPEAQLPKLEHVETTKEKMVLIYKSERAMSDFAKGLIIGCLDHFNEKAEIEVSTILENKTEVQFTITLSQ